MRTREIYIPSEGTTRTIMYDDREEWLDAAPIYAYKYGRRITLQSKRDGVTATISKLITGYEKSKYKDGNIYNLTADNIKPIVTSSGESCIYSTKSGKYSVIKYNRYIGQADTMEAAKLMRDNYKPER